MNIIDVTLRDGGHAVNFDWDLATAKEYYNLISDIDQVSYVELGYWKQTAKTTNYFYNLDQEKVEKITGKNPIKKASVMIDYHYCSKNYEDYPTNKQDAIGIIRVCCRKNDIDEALPFIQGLKKHTGLKVSVNIFNISNYEQQELLSVCQKVMPCGVEYVYFADTHGSLDLTKESEMFVQAVNLLSSANIKVGMHLHNHSGKAFLNYNLLSSIGFSGFDASTRGMGKGVGNLRLEEVISKDKLAKLMAFVLKEEKVFTMRESPYGMITSKYSISDYYAYNAEKMGMEMQEFDTFCSKVSGIDKDVYNSELWDLK